MSKHQIYWHFSRSSLHIRSKQAHTSAQSLWMEFFGAMMMFFVFVASVVADFVSWCSRLGASLCVWLPSCTCIFSMLFFVCVNETFAPFSVHIFSYKFFDVVSFAFFIVALAAGGNKKTKQSTYDKKKSQTLTHSWKNSSHEDGNFVCTHDRFLFAICYFTCLRENHNTFSSSNSGSGTKTFQIQDNSNGRKSARRKK